MAEKTKKLLRRSRNNRPTSEGNHGETQQFKWLSFFDMFDLLLQLGHTLHHWPTSQLLLLRLAVLQFREWGGLIIVEHVATILTTFQLNLNSLCPKNALFDS